MRHIDAHVAPPLLSVSGDRHRCAVATASRLTPARFSGASSPMSVPGASRNLQPRGVIGRPATTALAMTLTAHPPVDDDEQRLAALWDDQPTGIPTGDDAIGRLFAAPDGTERDRDTEDIPGRRHDRRSRSHTPRRPLRRPRRPRTPNRLLLIGLAGIASATIAAAGSQLLTSAPQMVSEPQHRTGTATSVVTPRIGDDSRPVDPPRRTRRPRPDAPRETSASRRKRLPVASRRPRHAAHQSRAAAPRAPRPRALSPSGPTSAPPLPAPSSSACDEFPPC